VRPGIELWIRQALPFTAAVLVSTFGSLAFANDADLMYLDARPRCQLQPEPGPVADADVKSWNDAIAEFDYTRALPAARHVLQELDGKPQAEHWWRNLGCISERIHDLDEAIKATQKAYDISHAAAGTNPHEALDVTVSLAAIYQRAGQYDKAGSLLNAEIDKLAARYRPGSANQRGPAPAVLSRHDATGDIYAELIDLQANNAFLAGNTELAIRLFKATIDACDRFCARDSPVSANLHYNFGDRLREMQQPQAKQQFEIAYRFRHGRPNVQALSLAEYDYHLSRFLAEIGDLDNALPLVYSLVNEAGKAAMQSELSDRTPNTAIISHTLAIFFYTCFLKPRSAIPSVTRPFTIPRS
jgi:tetratricopeptide (TPR) repeat protein